ncbi:ROK family protein [Candidatus Peregrinibacteria bacterium]|nr:ROK family protein [Candidatus Peregrinibacteria bacterium]
MGKKVKFIGVDVGGNKILAQAFDENLKMIGEEKRATNVRQGKKGFLEELFAVIDLFFHKGVKGIGIGMPGIVDIRKGVLVKAPHLPVGRNFPLRELLKKHYKTPIRVDNDVNAFLLAEKERPELKKYKNLVAVMVGTGVGGAITINGELVYGKNGYAGEVGHMVINKGARLKSFEQNTSGHFIREVAKSLGYPNVNSETLEKMRDEGMPAARNIIRSMAESFGTGLSNLNLILNPDAFVLGGSVYHIFFAREKKKITEIIKKHSLDGTCPPLIQAGPEPSVAKGVVMGLLP